jgi:aminomethyltransferase
MLNEKGGVIDDLIAYRTGETDYFLVVNASMIDEDFFWMAGHQDEQATLRNESDLWAGLAIQGPLAAETFAKVCPGEVLPARNGISTLASGAIVCRTGYTGEDGFEFFCPAEEGVAWWEKFLAAGAAPCGLGARDTLRLEMGYPLNGNDLSPERTPIEAGLGWITKFTKDFVDRERLEAQKTNGTDRILRGLRVLDRGIPRHGYTVEDASGRQIGEVTSGTMSPTLGYGIGLAYLSADAAELGSHVFVRVRNNALRAEVVRPGFLPRG